MTETGIINIVHDDYVVPVNVKDDIEWTLSRQGSPGKLKFTIINPSSNISEGDVVQFFWDSKPVFYGFLFSRTTNKLGQWECVAYDQIRYLKNKDTIVFEDADTPDLIYWIEGVFGVKFGKNRLANYKFTKVESNKSGLDMIGDFCDEILINKKQMFVLYDNFGSLEFMDIEKDMQVNYLVDENTSEDFDYTISIDDQTYNRIKLISKDSKEQVTMSIDQYIKKWGLLQLYEEVDKTPTEWDVRQLLDVYGRPSKKLKIKNAKGNFNVRAGCWFPVVLDLGIEKVQCPLIVEQITHHFKADNYTMDMTLRGGGGFVA